MLDCKRYIKQTGLHLYPRDQVEAISSFLTGKALTFFVTKVGKNASHWTFESFLESLVDFCFPTNYRQQLHGRFRRCRQGNRTIQEFESELESLVTLLGDVGKRDKINRLWYGSKGDYQRQLFLAALDPEISSYQDVLDRLVMIERSVNNSAKVDHKSKDGSKVQSERDSDRPRATTVEYGKSRGGGQNSHARSSQPQHRDSTSPVVGDKKRKYYNSNKSENRSKTPYKSNNKLSNEKCRQLLAEGKCFSCQQTGHLAKDCPKKNTARPYVTSNSITVDLDALDRNKELLQGSSIVTLRFLTKEGALFLREKIKVFTTPAKTLKDPESISKFLYTFVYALRVTSVYSFSVLN